MDFQRLILDHVTVPERARPHVGWRHRNDDECPPITYFEVTFDGGATWDIRQEWCEPVSHDDLRMEVLKIIPASRDFYTIEYREFDGKWTPYTSGQEE